MKYLILAIAALATGYVVSCSSDDSNSSFAYNGPGSDWTMVRSGSTYTINKVDGGDTLSIVATGTDLSTGHTKLVVDSASATGAETAPSPGAVAHALEVPGTAFLLLPTDPGAETIAMIRSGN